MLYYSQAAITNYSRLGGLDNKRLFLTAQGSGKPKILAPVDLVSGEDSVPGFQMATFLLCPHMAENRERRRKFSCLFIEGTVPVNVSPALMT